MTVLEVLQSSTGYFAKRKIDNARLNAEHLLARVLGRKRIEIYLEFERVLDESELAPLRNLVKRRGEGEPLQHLLGTVEFCGHTFLCDKRAMVPRPETEELVELLIADGGLRIAERIVDIGTGSGVIALSLAAKFPKAKIVATDICDAALALAAENATRLDLIDRVTFLNSDLFQNLSGLTEQVGGSEGFDVIVANLPYISVQDRQSLSREVLRDPEAALFGGERGDELIRRLIDQGPSHLQPNGLLALEIGASQGESLSEFLAQKNFHDIESKRDYAGIPRFLFAKYG